MSPVRGEWFESVLRAITTNRYVDVTAEIGHSLGIDGRTPVRARVLGVEFDTTLLPSRAGGYRLFVPSVVWKSRGVAVGDAIPVELWRVNESPVILPPELVSFAQANPSVAAAYHRITPADRRQIARYFESARSVETRQRRAAAIARRILSPRRPAKRPRG